MKKALLALMLCGVVIVGMAACSNPVSESKQELEKAQQELEATYEEFGWVEPETVDTLIAKYNTEIMDGGLGTPAYQDYMLAEEGSYWFALTDDIIFYLTPLEFTGNAAADIVDLSFVRMEKDNFNEATITDYAKKLIRANSYDLTDEEIDALIQGALELKSSGELFKNGSGILVGVYEDNDIYEFQVRRVYREDAE